MDAKLQEAVCFISSFIAETQPLATVRAPPISSDHRRFFVSEYFFHVLLDCNLFEMNISYGFGNMKAINLLRTMAVTIGPIRFHASRLINVIYTCTSRRGTQLPPDGLCLLLT